jgi:uncharacterized protein
VKAQEGKTGRVFVLKLENGDIIPDCIEKFATEKCVRSALCILIGAIGAGRLVVGPERDDLRPVQPMFYALEGVHEIAAVGSIFPAEGGTSRLHMHGALGRGTVARTGCVRPGLEVWELGEAIIMEIVGIDMVRKSDPGTGFEVLSAK